VALSALLEIDQANDHILDLLKGIYFPSQINSVIKLAASLKLLLLAPARRRSSPSKDLSRDVALQRQHSSLACLQKVHCDAPL
jgi:hypothetical protein